MIRRRWVAAFLAGLTFPVTGQVVSMRLVARHAGGFEPSLLSADGNRVLFSSTRSDLVPGVVDMNYGTDLFLFDGIDGTTTLVSRQMGSSSATPSDPQFPYAVPRGISRDGSVSIYMSDATDVAPGTTDHNETFDAFAFDRTAETTELASRASPTRTGDRQSWPTSISADGRFVVFHSEASDLTPQYADSSPPGSDFPFPDVFLLDRRTRELTLVSRSATVDATTANRASFNGIISADGRRLVFESTATDLVAGVNDVNGSNQDVFLYDVAGGTMALVSRASDAAGQTADFVSDPVALSADGNQVLFDSYASNLVAGVVDPRPYRADVFLFDRTTGLATLVSRAAGNPLATGNGESHGYAISADGDHVLFTSAATDLVEGAADANGLADVFVFDRRTGTVELVSRAAGAAQAANGQSWPASISADGRRIAFISHATDLIEGGTDTNAASDAFLLDRGLAQVALISGSLASSSVTANGGSGAGRISADGRRLLMPTKASDIIAGIPDHSPAFDLFLAEVVFLDFGDAPSSYGTVMADDGARHVLDSALFLGARRDAEVDALASAGAAGDDTKAHDDEDGVGALPAMDRGRTLSVDVVASGDGYLDAFADWNRNGEFDLPSEQVAQRQPVRGGPNALAIAPPPDAVVGTTFLRLRLSTAGGLGPNGSAADGEVEDHAFTITDASPRVIAITRLDPDPATSPPLRFAVTFSEPVAGVDSSDFRLVATGTLDSYAIGSVDCSASACTVTVSMERGEGTFRLNLADNDTIFDSAGNPLGGPGAGNGDATGEVYSVDLGEPGPPVPPVVSWIIRLDPTPTGGPSVRYGVGFSEAVTGVDVTDFILNATGELAGYAITGISGTDQHRIVTVATGTGAGALRLDVADDDSILDVHNNRLGGTGRGNGTFLSGPAYQVDSINAILLFGDGFEEPEME
jgi:Tol biopolymer transport system component